MGVFDIPPDSYTLNILMNCCSCLSEMRYMGGACLVKLLRGGLRIEIEPVTVSIFGGGGIARDGLPTVLLHYFLKCLRRVLNSTNATYSALIRGLGQAGKIKFARKHFDQMQLSGLSPSASVYTVLLDGLCKNGIVKRHWNFILLLREMDFNHVLNFSVSLLRGCVEPVD
ncbi:hypothetical protein Salat_0571100 [Sesamum alatum]|uniref:Pentatricopeptide repeat-containing protein n=1 Tax=Sesamum alatum TaxID=300844 RepID=A0AAE1YPA2_9LAMI|nr:hypothetical protein Salat_0571100 [Sesamum alatum]